MTVTVAWLLRWQLAVAQWVDPIRGSTVQGVYPCTAPRAVRGCHSNAYITVTRISRRIHDHRSFLSIDPSQHA
jgi:hypothetical protein